MKKIIYTLMILLFCASLAQANLIKNPSFEHNYQTDGDSANWPLADYWISSGASVADTAALGAQDGTWRAFTSTTAQTLEQLTDHLLIENEIIKLGFFVNSAVAGRGFTGQLYYDDNGTLVDIDGWQLQIIADGDTSAWQGDTTEFKVESGQDYIGKAIGIRFVGSAGFKGLDMVTLEALPVSLISPNDGQTDVLFTSTQLQWSVINGWACDLYFGKDSSEGNFPLLVENQVISTYDLTDLDPNSVYYWRVDAIDPNDGSPNRIEGQVWSFKTAQPKPIIDTDPAEQLIASGENAVYSVQARNPYTNDATNLTYQWYKYVDGVNDTLLANGIEYSDVDQNVMTVLTADIADEGDYYCIVSLNTSATQSALAMLNIKRLIGYWPFDNDTTDAEGDSDGVTTNTNYEPGIIADGQAIQFNPTDDSVAVSTDAHRNTAFTLSWWDRAHESLFGGSWESMVASGPTTGYEIFEADRYNQRRYAMGFNVSAGAFAYTPTGELLVRGQWNFTAVTFDPETKVSVWYINGEPLTQLQNDNFVGFDTELFIGNCRSGTQPYIGAIDDLKFYNYAMSNVDIALAYNAVTGQSVCADRPTMDVSGPDGTPDCRVNLYDFAVMASQWMDCGMVPASVCP
ncbi:MAG: LamG domain-containing protein [Phycisphaerae bacterium]|nr:LamG domain-containing protein [Phycisphaerae bacterium]